MSAAGEAFEPSANNTMTVAVIANVDLPLGSKCEPGFPDARADVGGADASMAQLPPTLRGVRVRGTKPRDVVAFHGWWV